MMFSLDFPKSVLRKFLERCASTRQQNNVKNRFYHIEDYTIESIWDILIKQEIPKLRTKPTGWNRPEHYGPEGDWTIALGMHNLASPEAYKKARISEPDLTQLPAIFCVNTETGAVEAAYNVTPDQAREFIQARI